MNINFSIIIPHKNIPVFLKRCLESIPKRDDIQVVIVDDNSDNPQEIECLRRDNVEIVYTTESKGAGYARNVGLKHAKGKWLVFSDADDFFNPIFNEMLDKYLNAEEDIIYFNIKSVYPDKRDVWLNYLHEEADENLFRYKAFSPWAKFIKRQLVVDNNITFREVKAANDMMFSLYTGYLAPKVLIVNEKIYSITYREDSIVHSLKDPELYKARIFTSFEVNDFYKKYNLPYVNFDYYIFTAKLDLKNLLGVLSQIYRQEKSILMILRLLKYWINNHGR